MPSIKKILFPVDFSPQSIGAARYVEALAGRFQARIQLLHVVGNGERILAEELLPSRQRQLDDFLNTELRYFDTEKVCVTGDPAEKIIEAADAWQPDLVMMPTHGVGLYRRLLLGSVTAKVLHDLDCPVWTDVHAAAAPLLENIHMRRILCAVDLTEQSRSILDWGAFLAEEYGAKMGIIHAVPAVESAAFAHYLDEEFVATIMAEAKGKLAALQSEAGTDAATFVEPGDPAKVIACAAQKFGADLVIIGRHARAGFSGHLRQNAYSILRESTRPVLSI
ncbi:MAG: universal stress protein [Acidobacteriia bacterium]|nr:universal stress protein [Terriglobia bacterium]